MGVFKQFATNLTAEKQGVRREYGANPDGTIPTLIIKRIIAESPAYQAAFTRVTKQYKHDIERNILDPEIDAMLMQRLCADQAVVGWENWRMPLGVAGGRGEGDIFEEGNGISLAAWQLGNGNEFDMPFSINAMADVFRVMPELYRDVRHFSTDPEQYKSGDLEEMAKNW